ncbi:MAG TPA: hypothetical protein VG324_19835, partial [Blastocatellia bacterium]|nr:hypothetical protein [Blastocatellia bacterium]
VVLCVPFFVALRRTSCRRPAQPLVQGLNHLHAHNQQAEEFIRVLRASIKCKSEAAVVSRYQAVYLPKMVEISQCRIQRNMQIADNSDKSRWYIDCCCLAGSKAID